MCIGDACRWPVEILSGAVEFRELGLVGQHGDLDIGRGDAETVQPQVVQQIFVALGSNAARTV